jgi:hypothetical protein
MALGAGGWGLGSGGAGERGAGSIAQRREVAKGTWRLGALARGMIFPLRRHVGNHEELEGHEEGAARKHCGLRILNRQGRPPRRVNCVHEEDGHEGMRIADWEKQQKHHAKARSRKGTWRLGASAPRRLGASARDSITKRKSLCPVLLPYVSRNAFQNPLPFWSAEGERCKQRTLP